MVARHSITPSNAFMRLAVALIFACLVALPAVKCDAASAASGLPSKTCTFDHALLRGARADGSSRDIDRVTKSIDAIAEVVVDTVQLTNSLAFGAATRVSVAGFPRQPEIQRVLPLLI